MALHSSMGTILLRILDGVVTQHYDYVSVGVGVDMADYWKRILIAWDCSGFPLDLLSAIGIYILWQTKQSVPGCGGRTAIATFTPGGGYVAGPSVVLVRQLEESFETVLRGYGSLICRVFNPEGNLEKALEEFSEKMKRAVSGPNAFYAQLKQMGEEIQGPHTEGK